MNKAAFLTRDSNYNQLQAIEAYRSSVLSQALNEPAALSNAFEVGGTSGINKVSGTEDTVELSEESLQLSRFNSPNADPNHQNSKDVKFEKTSSISDEDSDASGRNVYSPRVSKTGTMGPPAKDNNLYAARMGGTTTHMEIPGSTTNNQTIGVYDANNESAAEEQLKVSPTNIGISPDSAENTAKKQNAVNSTLNNTANVPPQAPFSLENSEGPDRKEQTFKTEDVSKTRPLERVQSNEATRTPDLSKELSESEAVRTREFLKDRYREPGIAVYVEPNNLSQPKNYSDKTLLQNVGSHIAQASIPANRISVYA